MIFESLTLVAIGLVVGLSGAVIPGPLLAFTLYDTSKKERVTGHYVVIGHVLWEFGVILLILLGFGWIILGNSQIIYLVGGIVLAIMGIVSSSVHQEEAYHRDVMAWPPVLQE